MFGSDTITHQTITRLVNSALRGNVFPCLEILVCRGKSILFHEVFGTPDPGVSNQKLEKNSLFDLASLTKPLATALAILHLVKNKQLALDDPLYKYFRGFTQAGIKRASIRHLLLHTSGLPDWVALYEPEFDTGKGWEKLLHIPLECNPGKKMIYSCLGYIVLGELIRKISGSTLNNYCRNHIYLPLNLNNLLFNPTLDYSQPDCVPTGYCTIRQERLKGRVHDENAALFYGEGGNSGLFGTASDIHKLCAMLIDEQESGLHTVISSNLLKTMFINQNDPALTPRSIGWDFKYGQAEYWSCSDKMPEGSIGHLGFTGTSLWIDPVSKIIIILLSNRVLLSREENIPQMRKFRPQMHELLISNFL